MKKRHIIFIGGILALLVSGIIFAEEGLVLDPAQAFKAANQKYAAGDFDGAINGYQALLGAGLKSGNLYYNLGNSYIKKAKLGEAILNYERAKLFIPRDSDLLSNFRYAKSLMKQKDVAQNRHWLVESVDMAFGYFTIAELLIIAFILIYSITMIAILCIFLSYIRPYLIPVVVILAAFLLAVIPPLTKKVIDLKETGIVTATITDARFEPLKRGEVHFPLYEGMKVYILTTKGDWQKIKRPDGKIGWVIATAVQPIIQPLTE